MPSHVIDFNFREQLELVCLPCNETLLIPSLKIAEKYKYCPFCGFKLEVSEE